MLISPVIKAANNSWLIDGLVRMYFIEIHGLCERCICARYILCLNPTIFSFVLCVTSILLKRALNLPHFLRSELPLEDRIANSFDKGKWPGNGMNLKVLNGSWLIQRI